MKSTIYITPEGAIHLCTVPVPEVPNLCSAFIGSDDGIRVEQCSFPMENNCQCGMRWFSYRQALKHCKESSVPFENWISVRHKLLPHITEFDRFYSVDCEVEIVEREKWVEGLGLVPVSKVARIKEDAKEEQKPDDKFKNFKINAYTDLSKFVFESINAYWKFDDNQIPMSSWHDKQDLMQAIESIFKKSSEEPRKEESPENEYGVWLDYGRIHLSYSLEAAEKKVKDPSKYVFEKLSQQFTITRIVKK